MNDLGMASITWLSEHIYLFAGLWMLLFGLVPALVSRFTVSRSPVPIPAPPRRPLPYPMFLGIVIGLAFATWAALAIAWNAFTFPDAQILFSGVRDGVQHYPPPIWPTSGRFFPLGHQEFELLGLIDTSGVVYHLFATLQLAVVCAAVIALVRPSWPVAPLLVLAIVAAPPVWRAFNGLVMTERNIIFFLAISLLCLRFYLRSGAPAAIFLTMAAMAPIVLYKETAFIFPAVLGFALMAAGVMPRLFQEADTDRRRYLVAGVSMLVLAGVFVLYYGAVIRPHVEVSYAAKRQNSIGEVAAAVFVQPWSWVLSASIVVRIWLLLARKYKPDPLWDSLPAAAVVYTAAFVVLGLKNIWYFAPIAFTSWLYAVHLVALAQRERRNVWAMWIGLVALAACIVMQLGPTWNIYSTYKEKMHARASAARFVADYATIEGLGSGDRPIYIHVIDATAFNGGTFGAFINAKYGLNVVVALPAHNGEKPFRCVGSESIACDPTRRWETGDLVVPLTQKSDDDLKDRRDVRLVFTSEDIGFWRNRPWTRISVYVIE